MKEFSLAKATLIVCGIHLFLILWLAIFDDATVPLKPTKRLTVQTISISAKNEPIAMISTDPINDKTPQQATKPAETSKPVSEPTRLPLPSPKLNAEPKRVEQKTRKEEVAKKREPTRKTEPAPKPELAHKSDQTKKTATEKKPQTLAADPRKKELLAQAQASISKIQQNQSSFKLDGANVKGDAGQTAPGYRDELVSRLQMMLRLPERGDVRIKLTLSKNGKFVKVEIVDANSAVNRKYVEKSLPTIQFPPFGRELGNAAESTFNITLSSEI